MRCKRAAWLVWLAVNVLAATLLLMVLFFAPPWARRGMDDEVLLFFALAVAYAACNWYFMFRARNVDDWLEDTLPGLWIQAKKAGLWREIAADSKREDG